jgi:hypothetical protein
MQKTHGSGKQVTQILHTFSLNMNKTEKHCQTANVSDIMYHCICAVLRYVCMERFLIGCSITVYSVRIES